LQLDQLKLDMQAIEELDKSLAERLKKVDEQIIIAIQEANSAEKTIQKLWQIIDHNKARSLYYQLKGTTVEKLQSIASYLQGALLQDFERAGQTVKFQLTKTLTSVKALEEKGFIIKSRTRRIESIKLKELKAEADAAKQVPTEQEVVLSQKPKPQQSWYVRFYNSCIDIVAQGIHFIQTAFTYLFGIAQVPGPKKAPNVQQVPPQQSVAQVKPVVALPAESVQPVGMPSAAWSKQVQPVMPSLPNVFNRS
jgi:hypothetical protein